jgi:hypothetical protein
MSGKTSAEIAKGDVPAVGEYAIMYRIPKEATKGTRATWTPAAFSLKENARINIRTNIGINPRRRRVAQPVTSSSQKAGAPKLSGRVVWRTDLQLQIIKGPFEIVR